MNGEPETIAGIPAAVVQEALEKRQATALANQVPFPGPLKDAFSIAPNIKVGEFSVRPFYDGDCDLLMTLGNPFGEFISSTLDAKNPDAEYKPRGQTMWEICYLFTNDIEKCESEIRDGTFKENAKKSFYKFRLPAFMEIHRAVTTQLGIYWSTSVGHTEEEQSEDGMVKKK